MKIFTAEQLREIDKYTIEHEPISSLDLMERAARAMTAVIVQRYGKEVPVVVFAGPGNNGGDALAVARQLHARDYQVEAFLFNTSGKLSPDCEANSRRLTEDGGSLTEITLEFDPPRLTPDTLIIDGLFGSGLDRPLAGGFATLVKYINQAKAQVVSLDVPSGLMAEDNSSNVHANIVRARLTITLQQPKLAFFFPESQECLGEVVTADIGLSREAMEATAPHYATNEAADLRNVLRPRSVFAHKGDMGHALLVAGSSGMAGAAILAARACLRGGAGKVTVRTPRQNVLPLQVAVPEAVLSIDRDEMYFSEAIATEPYDAIATGPGLGTDEQTAIALISQLRRATCPVVVDADALNILAARHAWLQQLPKEAILTPHPKELDRIEGDSRESYERLDKARQLAKRIEGYVILKGHHTAVCMPDGLVMLNTTGNAGMATAGSGDVLTGLLLALLARGYDRREACLLAVWLHGRAGDIAAGEKGMESLIASDITDSLPRAFKELS